MCFSCGKPGNAAKRCPNVFSISAARMAGGEDAGWVYDNTAMDNNGSPAGGKRRLIREGGGLPLGSGITFGPGIQEVDQCQLFLHNG